MERQFWESGDRKGAAAVRMEVSEIIREVARQCGKSGATRAVLFGSRAKGTARERSDIDIAVWGADDFEELKEAMDEIPTLYTIDVVNMDTCENKLLLEDVKKYGQKIYEKEGIL